MKRCKRNPLLTLAYDSFPLETTKTSLSHDGERDEKTALNLQELQNMIKSIRKRELPMRPFTLGLMKETQAWQWLLALPEYIPHQPLHPTGNVPLVAEAPAATGGLETPVKILPHGERPMASRYPSFFLLCFAVFAVSAFLGYPISTSYELAQIFLIRGNYACQQFNM